MTFLLMSKQIAASPRAVFDRATDFENAPERIRGIESMEILTDGPIGVGTRLRETRIMFKKEHTEEFEITEFTPGKSFSMEAESCGCRYVCTHRFLPDASGTNLEIAMEMQPITFFAKIMSPLGRLMMGSMKKCIDADLEDIKTSVEGSGELAAMGATE